MSLAAVQASIDQAVAGLADLYAQRHALGGPPAPIPREIIPEARESSVTLRVFRFIEANPGCVRSDVQRALGVRHGSCSGIIDYLRKKGMVAPEPGSSPFRWLATNSNEWLLTTRGQNSDTRGGRQCGDAPKQRELAALVARHPGLNIAQYALLLGVKGTSRQNGLSQMASRAEVQGFLTRERVSARRTRLHPGFEFEYERPEPPTGRLAMRLLGHVESQPGVTIRQLGSEHGLTQDIASSLVREFVVSGVMYVTGDGAPLSRTVYCVPRDWPTRPSVGVTDGDRERLMVAGYGER